MVWHLLLLENDSSLYRTRYVRKSQKLLYDFVLAGCSVTSTKKVLARTEWKRRPSLFVCKVLCAVSALTLRQTLARILVHGEQRIGQRNQAMLARSHINKPYQATHVLSHSEMQAHQPTQTHTPSS